MNLYYDDLTGFGLTKLGEIDWSNGRYQFDLTVVWRRDSDGALLYAEDAGCSCPTPFESQTAANLTEATQAELQVRLQERNADVYDGDRSGEIVELMSKVVNP